MLKLAGRKVIYVLCFYAASVAKRHYRLVIFGAAAFKSWQAAKLCVIALHYTMWNCSVDGYTVVGSDAGITATATVYSSAVLPNKLSLLA